MTSVTQPVFWRVYQPQWQAVYTSDQAGYAGSVEVQDFVRETYGGRIRDGEARISVPDSDCPEAQRVTGEVLLPNLQGEWKDRGDADGHCRALGEDAVVVGAGSAEERVLLGYGRKRLPDA